jgi:KDO2-lipid IV(A) lauroyltransferase
MSSPAYRAFRGRVLYAVFNRLGTVVRRMPLRVARVCGVMLGELASHVVRRDRRRALANLAIAFPDWTPARRRRTMRAMFRHLGRSLFEILWLPNLTYETMAESTLYEGTEAMEDAIRRGRSVIAFTAHCGNWEWMAYGVGVHAHGLPITVLQRERNEADMNRFITELRMRAGVRSIDRGSKSAARELIQATRNPGLLAFLIDQNIRTESVKVPFFGKPAPTPIGPAKFAVRAKALAIVVFVERLPSGKQLIRFHEPFEVAGHDAVELTARVTRVIEEQIRRVPEQWVWFHDRWRERPKWDVSAAQS